MKRLMIKSNLALAAVAAVGVASALKRTIEFGLSGPETHPAAAGMKRFAETVAAKAVARSRSTCSSTAPWAQTRPWCRPSREALLKWPL